MRYTTRPPPPARRPPGTVECLSLLFGVSALQTGGTHTASDEVRQSPKRSQKTKNGRLFPAVYVAANSGTGTNSARLAHEWPWSAALAVSLIN